MAHSSCIGLVFALVTQSTLALGALRGQARVPQYPLQAPPPSVQDLGAIAVASDVPSGSDPAALLRTSACQFCALQVDDEGCFALDAGAAVLEVTPAGCERCHVAVLATCRERAQRKGPEAVIGSYVQPVSCLACAAAFADAGGCELERAAQDYSSLVTTECQPCGGYFMAACEVQGRRSTHPSNNTEVTTTEATTTEAVELNITTTLAPEAQINCSDCCATFVHQGGCPILAEAGYWDTEPYVPVGCEPCMSGFTFACSSTTPPANESNLSESSTTIVWSSFGPVNDTLEAENVTTSISLWPPSANESDTENTTTLDVGGWFPLPVDANESDAENATAVSASASTTPGAFTPPPPPAFANESDEENATSTSMGIEGLFTTVATTTLYVENSTEENYTTAPVTFTDAAVPTTTLVVASATTTDVADLLTSSTLYAENTTDENVTAPAVTLISTPAPDTTLENATTAIGLATTTGVADLLPPAVPTTT